MSTTTKPAKLVQYTLYLPSWVEAELASLLPVLNRDPALAGLRSQSGMLRLATLDGLANLRRKYAEDLPEAS